MRVVSLYVGLFFLFFSSFFCFRVNWIGGLGSFLYFSPSETATRLLLMPAMVECNCIASVEGFSFMMSVCYAIKVPAYQLCACFLLRGIAN